MFPHGVPSGRNSTLSGFVKGFLNGVFVDPSKIGAEPLKVNSLRGDSMFMLSHVGDKCLLSSPLKIAKCEGSGAQVGSPDVVGGCSQEQKGPIHGDQ